MIHEHILIVFFFKQKTAYEMRISYWSSDVCSSDLPGSEPAPLPAAQAGLDHFRQPLRQPRRAADDDAFGAALSRHRHQELLLRPRACRHGPALCRRSVPARRTAAPTSAIAVLRQRLRQARSAARSEEHTSELQ